MQSNIKLQLKCGLVLRGVARVPHYTACRACLGCWGAMRINLGVLTPYAYTAYYKHVNAAPDTIKNSRSLPRVQWLHIRFRLSRGLYLGACNVYMFRAPLFSHFSINDVSAGHHIHDATQRRAEAAGVVSPSRGHCRCS